MVLQKHRESKSQNKFNISQRQTISKLMEKKYRGKTLLSSQQTTYVKNRHNGKIVKLISDISKTAKLNNLEGFLFAIDSEKAFEYFDHTFFISILKKNGFCQKFIFRIKAVL